MVVCPLQCQLEIIFVKIPNHIFIWFKLCVLLNSLQVAIMLQVKFIYMYYDPP